MANENDRKLAESVYEKICEVMDEDELTYNRHDDKLVITLSVRGDDIPMDLVIFVHEDRKLVRLVSPMPFKVPEDKRAEMAIAVNVANYGMYDGSFDYDFSDGDIRFRFTTSYYRDSTLGKEVFQYMLALSVAMVDKYNDRFMMLSKGMISLDRFIQLENS